jgi:hypothetical protein
LTTSRWTTSNFENVAKVVRVPERAGLLSCALAASTTAVLTGALSGVGLYCLRHLHEVSNAVVYTTGIAALLGIIIGTPPAALVICLSRAKYAPWRSLPLLVSGAALGILVIGLPWSLFPFTEDVAYLAVGMPIAGAILGGAVATRFVPSTSADQGWPIAAVPGFVFGLLAGATVLAFLVGAALSRFAMVVSAVAVPKYVLALMFIVYLFGESIAFVAVIHAIPWNSGAFWKGLGTGLLAAVVMIAGFVLFMVPTSGS